MTKFEDNMNNIFDLAPAEKVEVVQSAVEQPISEADIQKDYEHARAHLYSLIEKGQEAVSGILDVATSSDHPRAYEVAGQLIKNVADTTDKLLDLQAKLKKLKEEEGPKTVTTNNTMFIGSTSELQKLLKNGLPKE